jgi:hypothetical protein
MGDISDILPENSPTVQAIYDWRKREGDKEAPREYLGASLLGHDCERFVWYSFNDCVREYFDGRMYRLFETGHLAENRFAFELYGIGVKVTDRDDFGNQYAVSAIGGHFRGHMDGAGFEIPEAPKTWHVLEYKTHSEKSFKKLKETGVKESKPQHYAQMMVYMHLTGMTRALYLAVNKNTDELYSERIRYNVTESKTLMERAERIITAKTAPARISEKPDYFKCMFCSAHKICWGCGETALSIPYLSCRQCVHSTPEMDTDFGRWSCAKHGTTISRAQQFASCADHLVLPDLIAFAVPTDSTDGSIEFTCEDKTVFINGTKEGEFSTKELMLLSRKDLAGDKINMLKQVFGGTIAGVSDESSWKGNMK